MQVADVVWVDYTITSDKLGQLKGFQIANHFPAMCGITKKNSLAALLKKMKDLYPADF